MTLAFFWILGTVAIAGGVLCITRTNAVASALNLVMTLFALAGMYAMLDAHFIAVMQVIVYAGAIMVLFVFAIMVLIPGKEETGPDPRRVLRLWALPFGAVLLLLLGKRIGEPKAGCPCS